MQILRTVLRTVKQKQNNGSLNDTFWHLKLHSLIFSLCSWKHNLGTLSSNKVLRDMSGFGAGPVTLNHNCKVAGCDYCIFK